MEQIHYVNWPVVAIVVVIFAVLLFLLVRRLLFRRPREEVDEETQEKLRNQVAQGNHGNWSIKG